MSVSVVGLIQQKRHIIVFTVGTIRIRMLVSYSTKRITCNWCVEHVIPEKRKATKTKFVSGECSALVTEKTPCWYGINLYLIRLKKGNMYDG